MTDTKRDIKEALYGSPNGFLDILLGAVLIVVGLVRWFFAVLTRWRRRG